MIFYHHDLMIALDDSWWAEAQMTGFVPTAAAYRVDLDAPRAEPCLRIDEIGPLRRDPGVGIFNNNEIKTARERVLCILKGFRTGASIPRVDSLALMRRTAGRWANRDLLTKQTRRDPRG